MTLHKVKKLLDGVFIARLLGVLALILIILPWTSHSYTYHTDPPDPRYVTVARAAYAVENPFMLLPFFLGILYVGTMPFRKDAKLYRYAIPIVLGYASLHYAIYALGNMTPPLIWWLIFICLCASYGIFGVYVLYRVVVSLKNRTKKSE